MDVYGLFSGIGGFELGFQRAGFRIKGMCEIDDFCRRVLARNFPSIPIDRDVHSINPRADIFTGGFPCQDLSIAGDQAGLEGSRSSLWKEYLRCVGDGRPRWVVIENVGHTWRRWVPAVRVDLAGLGYSSLPLRVRASDLGACHERSRIFLVAHADREFLRKLSRWWCWKGWEMAQEFARTWDSRPRRLGADDGLPTWVDQRRAIGNAIVPYIAEIIATGIKEVA